MDLFFKLRNSLILNKKKIKNHKSFNNSKREKGDCKKRLKNPLTP